MNALTRRVAAMKEELAALQSEIDALPAFLGKSHAVNGLRQAQTYVSDCILRLSASHHALPQEDRTVAE